jgi:hypothetical protein
MFKRLALGLVVTLVAVLGLAVPAQAAPTCDFHLICWFDQNNWQGNKYVVNPSSLPQHTCFNMSTDPNTGINWDRIVDSVWWNDILYPDVYVEFYEGQNCTIAAVTRADAWTPVDNQMQSCLEGSPEWHGPCGPPNNVSHRIRSWAFSF